MTTVEPTYNWSIDIPVEPTPNIVLVRKISLVTQEATIKDFFSFCGIIKAFEMKRDEYDEQHQVALVYFEQEAAAKTATLLSQAEVDESPIIVEPYFKQAAAAAVATPMNENPANMTTTTNSAQQNRSVSHVMTELLASGYVLTDSVITKGVEFDQKHGVSTRVSGYLNKVGINLNQGRTSATTAGAATTTDASNRSTTQDILPSRMKGLINSRASLKMQGFASRVTDKVSVVHNEAKKIAAEKKKNEGLPIDHKQVE